MSVFQRIVENLKAMSTPAKEVIDEMTESFDKWLTKQEEKYTKKDLDEQFDEMKKLRESVLNRANAKKVDNISLIKDTLLVDFISLVAKLAKADGVVVKEEVEAFDKILKNEFSWSVEERKIASNIFNAAKTSSHGYQAFAKQIAENATREICLVIYSVLFKISSVNKSIPESVESFVLDVGNIFKVNQNEFDDLRKKYFLGEMDPYEVLGVNKSQSYDEIKKIYKKLAMENHPDRLAAKGLPEDFIKEAQERLSRINAAWDKLEKTIKK